ncbi:hypothetical protein B0H94_11151 [Salsuginibacillus halophilus]|uniref:Uncharacterized protein n=1 Tax=Salsuginibacillus halophilus TaxID=517424 RepID=A0A2P8HAH6_9BACI|nr:hypothetical protein [Salsuginibacillus halophilus]PSL43228.1 hypothetical protein B0H94_11151 [Salsuginibacillus halophilus]
MLSFEIRLQYPSAVTVAMFGAGILIAVSWLTDVDQVEKMTLSRGGVVVLISIVGALFINKLLFETISLMSAGMAGAAAGVLLCVVLRFRLKLQADQNRVDKVLHTPVVLFGITQSWVIF